MEKDFYSKFQDVFKDTGFISAARPIRNKSWVDPRNVRRDVKISWLYEIAIEMRFTFSG